MENSQAHPFYSELVNVNPHTKQFTSVLLSKYQIVKSVVKKICCFARNILEAAFNFDFKKT